LDSMSRATGPHSGPRARPFGHRTTSARELPETETGTETETVTVTVTDTETATETGIPCPAPLAGTVATGATLQPPTMRARELPETETEAGQSVGPGFHIPRTGPHGGPRARIFNHRPSAQGSRQILRRRQRHGHGFHVPRHWPGLWATGATLQPREGERRGPAGDRDGGRDRECDKGRGLDSTSRDTGHAVAHGRDSSTTDHGCDRAARDGDRD
jgi:hypothetical protein